MKPNKPYSENREFYKRLLLMPATAIVTIAVCIILNRHHIISLSEVPKGAMQDSVALNPSNEQATSIDSTAIIKADQSMVDDLELSWGEDRVNIKQALENIAGVEGVVNWSINYTAAKQKNNPDLFTAIGHAENKEGKKPKTFDITLLVNRQNKRFKVVKAVDNGEVLKGPMVIMSLALEGGYSHGVSF